VLEIVGVLLAAGAGSRFGGDKLMHRLADRTPMAMAAARNLLPACDRVVAVVRPQHDELAALLAAAGCEIIHCSQSAAGMGHSLAAGVQATSRAAGWIVALADMPFIARGSHEAVAASLRSGASLVATQYQGKRGHPVGFSKAWYPQLTALTSDQGGKAILEQYPEKLFLCPVDDPGVIRDIDRREDLQITAAT
jgi:molybdenum cofactor cytidylyltransferase